MGKKSEISRENCIYAICNFVIRYRANKEHTPFEIYENTGYEKYYRDITQEQIAEMIRHHPDLIEAWLLFSQDKRWTPAWFFTKCPKNLWEVGYIDSNGKYLYKIMFNDSVIACAQMVRMEMEEFRVKENNSDLFYR